MNKSISKIILSLMIFFFLTISFSCSNPSSDNSTANPTSQPTPNNPPAPTPDPEVYYTIIFNKNNESATGSTTSIKAKADSIVTLTANSFTLVGYNFTGWNTKADGTGTGYDDVSSLELTDDMTLYAQWGIASYSISIVEINHAPFIQSDTIVQFPTINVNKSQANYGESIEISIKRNNFFDCESVTVIGHDGSIIYTINDFDKHVYNYSYSFDMPDQEVTVNFAYNSSWYSVKIINSTPELGEVSLLGNGLNSPGYVVALAYKPNEYYRLGTVSVYDSDNNPIDVVVPDKWVTDTRYDFVMPDKNITIVVSFELISYIVKFNTDCSVQIPELKVERNPQIPQDQHANLYLADNSDCKGFLGWYTEPECIHQFDLNSKIDKNMTLYAKWDTFIVNTKEQQKTRIPAIKYSCWIEGRFDEILLMIALNDLYINKPEIRISLKYASPKGGVCEKSGVNKNVVSVVLPEDMTVLVKYAFANFTALKSVVLPEGLEYISKGAFMNCTALEQITIPKNVLFIEESIFEGCSSLKSIDLSENRPIYAIQTAMFKNCSSLENIKLPETNNKQYIYSEAFYGCKSLRSIILPETIEKIGVNAFSLCTALNSVEFKKLPNLCFAEDNDGKTKSFDITDDKSKNAEFITNTYSDCSLSFYYPE